METGGRRKEGREGGREEMQETERRRQQINKLQTVLTPLGSPVGYWMVQEIVDRDSE